MLTKLKLRNFQRHAVRTIKFDKRVTVIVGPNDTGKTAVVRSLKWILFNKGNTKVLVRHGAKKATASLDVKSKGLERSVKRVAGKGVNEYVLDNKILKAFRTDVPDPIAGLLNVAPINLQSQHENSFWFSLSPGAVTRELNKLIDLDSIDRIQANLNKQLREAKTLLNDAKARIRTEKTACRDLAWVRRLAASFRGIPPLMGGIRSKRSHVAAAASLLGAGSRLVPHCRQAAGAAAGAAGVGGSAAAAAGLRSRCWGLADAAARGADASGLLADVRSTLAAAKQIKMPKRPDDLRELVSNGNYLLDSIEHDTSVIDKKKAKIEKKLGGRCPSCGGILSDQSLI